jgi:hypothetical protein
MLFMSFTAAVLPFAIFSVFLIYIFISYLKEGDNGERPRRRVELPEASKVIDSYRRGREGVEVGDIDHGLAGGVGVARAVSGNGMRGGDLGSQQKTIDEVRLRKRFLRRMIAYSEIINKRYV